MESKLPFTSRQQWHLIILKYLVELGGEWGRPQNIQGMKFERVHELHSHGIIERDTEKNTGAARAFIYRVTPEGSAYYVLLKNDELFNVSVTRPISLFNRLRYYLISGDMRAAYPYCVAFLQGGNGNLPPGAKKEICDLMLGSGNGYLHNLATMYLTQGYEAILGLNTSHAVTPTWLNAEGETVKYKALNMKVTQAGQAALNKITARMAELNLRSHLKGHPKTEGFAAELALITLASQLDEWLPVPTE